jgi:hypothetical protein
MTDSFPTADDVAVAIVASAREVAPMEVERIAVLVASGEQVRGGPNGHVEIARARAYAAMALRSRFKASAFQIGRLVGAGSPASYLSVISHDVAKGLRNWWDDDAFDRVAAALDAQMDREDGFRAKQPQDAPARPAGPLLAAPAPIPQLARPAVSPGKRNLMEELRRAVENTARMTPPQE